MARPLFLLLTLLTPAFVTGQFGHVFVLVEENREYSSVVGDTINAPFFNSLIRQYGLATNFYADVHPSIGNYFMLTTGQIFTKRDNFSGTFSGDNVLRHFVNAGVSWKVYAEGYPKAPGYVNRHNVFVFFSDVRADSTLRARIVESDTLASDIAQDLLPQYGFIIPNLLHDGHDGTLAEADSWAQTHIAPLIASPEFQADGLLIITWDEGAGDSTHGGGHICTIIVSPLARAGYRSTTFFQHESILRLSMRALGLTSFPGAAASAPEMDEFFTTVPASDNPPARANRYSLSQNYPNPFNPETTIPFQVPVAALVSLRVYDLLGREVATLVNERKLAGRYAVKFEGSGMASGIYYLRMQARPLEGGQAADVVRTRKLVIMR